ncbi:MULTISPECIES: hypothetical protein [Pantoea]|uniref:hypothetical protein n=1 Tax=Pantoea TaxID=53335 RepID=UPI0015FDBB46|nr:MULTISPECIES: hypothetical protein [Pantoea]
MKKQIKTQVSSNSSYNNTYKATYDNFYTKDGVRAFEKGLNELKVKREENAKPDNQIKIVLNLTR